MIKQATQDGCYVHVETTKEPGEYVRLGELFNCSHYGVAIRFHDKIIHYDDEGKVISEEVFPSEPTVYDKGDQCADDVPPLTEVFPGEPTVYDMGDQCADDAPPSIEVCPGELTACDGPFKEHDGNAKKSPSIVVVIIGYLLFGWMNLRALQICKTLCSTNRSIGDVYTYGQISRRDIKSLCIFAVSCLFWLAIIWGYHSITKETTSPTAETVKEDCSGSATVETDGGKEVTVKSSNASEFDDEQNRDKTVANQSDDSLSTHSAPKEGKANRQFTSYDELCAHQKNKYGVGLKDSEAISNATPVTEKATEWQTGKNEAEDVKKQPEEPAEQPVTPGEVSTGEAEQNTLQDIESSNKLPEVVNAIRNEDYSDNPAKAYYQKKLLRLLTAITEGESINFTYREDSDNTALHYACALAHPCAFTLIECGAEVNRQNQDGQTPLDCIPRETAGIYSFNLSEKGARRARILSQHNYPLLEFGQCIDSREETADIEPEEKIQVCIDLFMSAMSNGDFEQLRKCYASADVSYFEEGIRDWTYIRHDNENYFRKYPYRTFFIPNRDIDITKVSDTSAQANFEAHCELYDTLHKCHKRRMIYTMKFKLSQNRAVITSIISRAIK